MKSAGKARSNGLYRHIRTSKEIIRNLLNDYTNNSANGLEDWTERNHKQHLLSLICVQQFAGHLMKEFRVVEHFFDFFLGAAVIQECLHFISGNAECLRHAKQVIIACRRVLVIAAVERIFAPPVLEGGSRRECSGSDSASAVNLQYLALLWLQNIGGHFQPQLLMDLQRISCVEA